MLASFPERDDAPPEFRAKPNGIALPAQWKDCSRGFPLFDAPQMNDAMDRPDSRRYFPHSKAAWLIKDDTTSRVIKAEWNMDKSA